MLRVLRQRRGCNQGSHLPQGGCQDIQVGHLTLLGQLNAHYTSPQSFKITVSYLLAYKLRGLLLIFDSLVQ